jgi:hypothetical protein
MALGSYKPIALGLFPRYLAKSLLLLIYRSTIFLLSDIQLIIPLKLYNMGAGLPRRFSVAVTPPPPSLPV